MKDFALTKPLQRMSARRSSRAVKAVVSRRVIAAAGSLSKRSYVCKPINIGSNTDPYQPIEKKWRLMRAALALLNECNHLRTIGTKNAMIERDLGILVPQMNGGKDYDSNFATRMRGQGVFADIIRKRVQVATRKAGLDRAWDTVLDTSQFVPPRVVSPQGELFSR